MLYWIAATHTPKRKNKDDEQKPEELILPPEIVVAKDEKSAAMKITVKASAIFGKYDLDRVNIFVRPF